MLWTGLCSRLHLPISERGLQLSHTLVSGEQRRDDTCSKSLHPLPAWFPVAAHERVRNSSKRSVHQLCSTTADPCEDAASAARLAPLMSLLSLPAGWTAENIRSEDAKPRYPGGSSKAWLLTWSHCTAHCCIQQHNVRRRQVQDQGSAVGSRSSEQELLQERSVRSVWSHNLLKTTHQCKNNAFTALFCAYQVQNWITISTLRLNELRADCRRCARHRSHPKANVKHNFLIVTNSLPPRPAQYIRPKPEQILSQVLKLRGEFLAGGSSHCSIPAGVRQTSPQQLHASHKLNAKSHKLKKRH